MRTDKRIMLVAQKQADVDDPKLDDLHRFGTPAAMRAASQPVRPCTVNTTASANPLEVAIDPGLKP